MNVNFSEAGLLAAAAEDEGESTEAEKGGGGWLRDGGGASQHQIVQHHVAPEIAVTGGRADQSECGSFSIGEGHVEGGSRLLRPSVDCGDAVRSRSG